MIRLKEEEDISSYGQSLLKITEMSKYDFLIPVGLSSCVAISQKKHLFLENTKALIPDWRSMKIAYDKGATMRLAKDIGVPMPWTLEIDEKSVNQVTDYPVVLKVQDDKGSFVRYCNNRLELEPCLMHLGKNGRRNPIVQQYIEGSGYGFYAIYRNGVMFDFFMIKRVHEMPITGGASSYAISIKNRLLFETGKRIADAMNWDGPIMVEFKLDPNDGLFKLIEVNPKLWGSLGITIAAGIDVPRIIIGILKGEIEKPLSSRFEDARYREMSFRWTFPDEFERLMSNLGIRELRAFIDSRPDDSNMDLTDPFPTIFDIGYGLISGARAFVDAEKRFPHGVAQRHVV